jgi:hypothetical protein
VLEVEIAPLMKPQPLRLGAFLAFILFTTLSHAQTTLAFKPIAKFNYPGAARTFAMGIDDSNNVVGAYIVEAFGFSNGFERYADGTFSDPIIAPGDDVIQTVAIAINNSGTIAGAYTDNTGTHGFFLTGGIYTVFDYPGTSFTMIQGINDAVDFVGYYLLPDGSGGAFVSIGGNLSPITIPGSTFISPADINNGGDIVGWYNTPDISSGFRLESDGTLHYPIRPPGSSAILLGTNETRRSVGQTYDGSAAHGLVYAGGRDFVAYDLPNTNFDELSGVNQHGFICGYGNDETQSETTLSFIVRVRQESE